MTRALVPDGKPASRRRIRPGLGWRDGVLVAVLAVVGVLGMSPPASAHGEGETEEGYLLVQQALGHLAHDTSHAGIELAMEKVDDALATKDQEGVAVAEVEQARQALEQGNADEARTLLQGSITKALSGLAPAVGEETGTSVVVPALTGRDGLRGRDWGFLVVSVLFLIAGAALAFLFRPHDTVGELSRRLGAPPSAAVGLEGNPTRVERNELR